MPQHILQTVEDSKWIFLTEFHF